MMIDRRQVDYQRAGQIRQALAERENALAYGNTERVKAAEKTLTELGYSVSGETPAVERDKPPAGRSTSPDQQVITEQSDPSAKTSGGRTPRA